MTGVLTHHRRHLSSRYSQKHGYPCTTRRHQLERYDLGPSKVAASVPERIMQHSLRRPVRNKEGSVTYCLKGGKCTLILFER